LPKYGIREMRGDCQAMHPSGQNLNFQPLLIRPTTGWAPLDLRALWQYRELLYFLAWRDVKVRYNQTVLGIAWAILQPFMMMVVFTIFFGRLMGVPSDGLPYPLFAYAALLPWQLFSRALTDASTSLVANERLVTRVYFPRLLIPAAAVMASFVDFAIAFVVFLGLMALYGITPTAAVIWLPFFVLLALMTALGIGLWLSALDAQYRDFRYTLPFLTQFWLFATPVVYPASLVPEGWRLLYGLNPMAGVVEGFRWALLGGSRMPHPMLGVSFAAVVLVFVGGLYYFRRMERTLADVV
jgi:lipopolysaccharide transport system permease protein